MKRIVIMVLGVVAVSAGAIAQTSDDYIERSLAGAPPALKANATVVKWKADFTYEVVKKGTNKLVCYDKSTQPRQLQPFSAECTTLGNLDRAAQNMKFEAIEDRAASKKAFDDAEKNGTRVKPEFGSVWIHFLGPDQAHAHTHKTIAMPMATSQTLGIPDKAVPEGVWLMDAGTTGAHIMVAGD